MQDTFRGLTLDEISKLEQQGCTSDNWNSVQVKTPFTVSNYRDVAFTGDIRLGTTGGTHTLTGGIVIQSGITQARLHNVSVGDDVFIGRIANYIANYDIADGAYIQNVDCLTSTGNSTFGNGTRVSVLNEVGGREVPIYERLSAQIAYLVAMYRHEPELVGRLTAMIDEWSEQHRQPRGRCGRNCRVVNSGTITDVNIGDYAVVDGASKLTNGSLASSEVDPVYVGTNVIATDFILASGAKVDDGALLLHTFVGQATHLTRLFSAHDSLFFANCACENGESCAVFGGPYTVTMHKSSLLIAGMFSFLNAGSGSNQSNHMYKLGPIHQGVVERGSKTTSDSYILWPARIGAFSLVMGRHVSHPDTSRLPFSYLIESAGDSHIIPGVNLKSVGTIRDAQKWPKRDRRRDPDRLDMINFNLLSPYTVSRMMDGVALLDAIESTSGATSTIYSYQGLTMNARALRKGREYYRNAINKFMGNSVVKRLESAVIESDDDVRKLLKPTIDAGQGEWLDLCGMFAPKAEIKRMSREIVEGTLPTLEAVADRFKWLQDNYYDMEWTWVVEHFKAWWGKEIDEVTVEDVHSIVECWRTSVVTIDNQLYDDARKEFSITARIGFGIDAGGNASRREDFEQVRGDFHSDPFVQMVLEHIKVKNELGDELLGRLPQN